jgi:hypothetical protein
VDILETTDKSGKVKLTVELEINQPAMELIRGNVEMMSQVMPQLLQNLRESMKGKGGQGGHGMGMMMRHCQE